MTETQSHPTQGNPSEELLENVPDKLHPVLQVIVDNIRFILAAIAILILALAGTAMYNSYQNSRLEKAQTRMAEILGQPADARVASLREFAKEAPESMQTALHFEVASTLVENGKHEEAAKELGIIAGNGHSLSAVAGLAQAAELTAAGKDADALKVLQALQKTAPASFKNQVLLRTAFAAEKAGDMKVALDTYKALEKEKALPLEGFAEFKAASIEAAQNK
ncbi:tetratricopeptide repeat protein [Desulfobaculum bizertense]|uniref:Ancillary SecYEG translocon subunit/Cell division coordinator CpoB TPR domain-containing protein n=1 Tax=Desulfobaculum bizertense DSM 18034 TaxID=1121442 RepID=A0A1T4VKV1_9BACT|nr:tetratricopeptide repeat protein [Desulfobaculum bizertense]UIJ38088.1 tetratricopeptide repeat protein [Desulfobaculum bizertense]SKA65498.1 hypothetical protein SAMN02745702_00561 [Desulfobaculum bizertense DSM 18034]